MSPAHVIHRNTIPHSTARAGSLPIDTTALTRADGDITPLSSVHASIEWSLRKGWHEIDPSDGIREAALRFLRVHPLRAADALQLAAAFVAAERRPPSLEVVTLDDRLAAAARREGFTLIEIPSDSP